jgi:hypothetical protein
MTDDEISELFSDPTNSLIENLLDRIAFIGDNRFIFAVPDNIPSDLQMKMVAAVKAHYGDYRSVDYVLKTYGSKWLSAESRKENAATPLYDLLNKTLCEVDKVCKWWISVDKVNGTAGIVVAGAALLRLQSSFRVASLLIRLGYVHEAASICRIILEQVAWAYRVHALSDQENPLRIPTKGSVSSLKQLFPLVGRLYNLLSAYTHISDEDARSYLSPDSTGQDWIVTRRTNEQDEFLIFIFIQLTDYYYVVSECVHRNYVQNPKSIRLLKNGEFEIVDERPVAKLIELCNTILAKQETERGKG